MLQCGGGERRIRVLAPDGVHELANAELDTPEADAVAGLYDLLLDGLGFSLADEHGPVAAAAVHDGELAVRKDANFGVPTG
jgi:hypothetical protein